MKEIKRYTVKAIMIDGTPRLSDTPEYNEGQFVKYTDHKAIVESLNKTRDDLLLVADHRWDELKKAEKRIEELKEERETLINCENCRFEPCDHNSECDSCQRYSRWRNNIGLITKFDN